MDDGAAQRCERCGRMLHDVQRLLIMVNGKAEAMKELCRACRTHVKDGMRAG